METSTKPQTELEDLLGSPPKKERMVTRCDGTQVPFSVEMLYEFLSDKLEGLNKEYMNLDLIVNKVK